MTRRLSLGRGGLSLAIAMLVALSGAVPGCRTRSKKRGSAPASDRARLEPDKRFGGKKTHAVWEIPCHHEVYFQSREFAGVESPKVTALRSRLIRRRALISRVLLHPHRLVWELPKETVPGGHGRLMLVLQPKSNMVALVSHKQRRFWADTPDRIAAWIEGSLKSRASAARLEVLGQGPEQRAEHWPPPPFPPPPPALPTSHSSRTAVKPPRHAVTHRLHGLLILRKPRGRGRGQHLRYEVTSWGQRLPELDPVEQGQGQLWDLLLLPFIEATSSKVLAAFRRHNRWPTRLRLVATQHKQQRLAGPGLEITLDLSARRRRTVDAKLLRLPPPGYRRMFGPLTFKAGRQLFHGAPSGLRKRHKGEPRRGRLTLRNPGRSALFVFADGILLGSLAPRARVSWNALPAGYFRFAALSLLGTNGWGPRDVYVPGAITLGQ